jgi:hypothetical protein
VTNSNDEAKEKTDDWSESEGKILENGQRKLEAG